MNHEDAVATLASERYLLDEMTELERHAFEEHFFECSACAEDVKAGAAMRQGAKSFFAEPGRRRASWHPEIVLPWAAAAMLAVGAGYQGLVVLPGLRHANAPAVVAPVTLHPASRGREPVVASGTTGAPILLGVDTTLSSSGGTVNYEVIGPKGTAIASGRTSLPPAGAPLFLVLSPVSSPGEYLLRLSDGLPRDGANAEYRFIVK